jgi:hypothetical protein
VSTLAPPQNCSIEAPAALDVPTIYVTTLITPNDEHKEMEHVWFEYLICAAGCDPHFQYQFHTHAAPSKPLAQHKNGAPSSGSDHKAVWVSLMKMKVEFMATLATQLPSNSTLFFLDVDVIVFRPLSELLSWVYADSFTFMWENNKTVNTGFYALRSGPTSIAMLDTWRKRSTGPKGKGVNDQSQMNAYLRENTQLKNTFPWEVATTHMGNIFS